MSLRSRPRLLTTRSSSSAICATRNNVIGFTDEPEHHYSTPNPATCGLLTGESHAKDPRTDGMILEFSNRTTERVGELEAYMNAFKRHLGLRHYLDKKYYNYFFQKKKLHSQSGKVWYQREVKDRDGNHPPEWENISEFDKMFPPDNQEVRVHVVDHGSHRREYKLHSIRAPSVKASIDVVFCQYDHSGETSVTLQVFGFFGPHVKINAYESKQRGTDNPTSETLEY